MMLLLAMSVLLWADAPPLYQPVEEYDLIRDTTSLEVDLGPILSDQLGIVRLSLHQSYRGKGRRPTTNASHLLFYSLSRQWRYQDDHSVAFLAGEKRFTLKVEADAKAADASVRESMSATLGQEQLSAMVIGPAVEGRLGSDDFRLNADQLAAIQELAHLVAEPTAPIRKDEPAKPKKPTEPQLRLRAAQDKENAGDQAGALAEYKDLLLLFGKSDQAKEAQEAVDRIEKQAKTREAKTRRQNLLASARNHDKAGKTVAALRYYRELVKDFPKSAEARIARECIKALEAK